MIDWEFSALGYRFGLRVYPRNSVVINLAGVSGQAITCGCGKELVPASDIERPVKLVHRCPNL